MVNDTWKRRELQAGDNTMTKWEGIITEKSGKPWNKIKLFSFKIEGEDRWFRTGRQEIAPPIGDRISFEERNQQVIMASVMPTTQSSTPSEQDVQQEVVPAVLDTPESAPSVAPAIRPGVLPPMGDSAQSVGDRIRWQAARRDACNVIVAALHCDALPWNTNVAKGKKLDLLVGYIHELTSQFVEGENT